MFQNKSDNNITDFKQNKQKLSNVMDVLFLTTPNIEGEMLNTWKKLGPLSI